jgi:hypothetical protein
MKDQSKIFLITNGSYSFFLLSSPAIESHIAEPALKNQQCDYKF